MTDYKTLLSACAIALTFLAFAPYIRSILQGKTRPHVFSWIIWGVTTFIVFLAQLADSGGVGAWPIGISGLITIFVAMLAYMKRGDATINLIDWAFLVAAFASLPLWYLSSSPFVAVLILTLVDLMGFGPTYRKAYFAPYEEQLLFFWLMMLRNVIAFLALEQFTPATITFPLVIALACFLFILMVLYRRARLSPS
jgi:hypothetical protein